MPIRVHLCAADHWLMRAADVPCFIVIDRLYALISAGEFHSPSLSPSCSNKFLKKRAWYCSGMRWW